MKTTYNAIIYKEWDQFVAQCLEIDVASYGTTYEHALDMLREAVELASNDSTGQISIVTQPRIVQFDLSHA
jgi:predicted RNase H-like HicB family nuclease